MCKERPLRQYSSLERMQKRPQGRHGGAKEKVMYKRLHVDRNNGKDKHMMERKKRKCTNRFQQI